MLYPHYVIRVGSPVRRGFPFVCQCRRYADFAVVGDAGEYLVGEANNYAEMYIPMTGTIGEELDTITELLAGKRYTYKIIMSSNVGYKDNGDPIKLAPIRFSVYEVSDWNDVTVTVKL